MQISQAMVEQDIASIRANNLIHEYVNASFMSANEKFNSAMVFESQPDAKFADPDELKLQRLLRSGKNEGESREAVDREETPAEES